MARLLKVQLRQVIPTGALALLDRQAGAVLIYEVLCHAEPPRLAQVGFPVDGAGAGLSKLGMVPVRCIRVFRARLTDLEMDQRQPMRVSREEGPERKWLQLRNSVRICAEIKMRPELVIAPRQTA